MKTGRILFRGKNKIRKRITGRNFKRHVKQILTLNTFVVVVLL